MEVLSVYQPKSADGKFMMPVIANSFQGLQEKFEVMFAEIREEFIIICKKSEKRFELLEQENRELNKTIEKLENRIDINDAYERKDT